MGRITKNYIYNLIYQLFIMLVPLVTAPYLVRVLGENGTGIFSYVNSFTYLLIIVTQLGIFTYGNRETAYVRDSKEALSKCFWQIMSTRLVLLLFGTVIYFGAVAVIHRYIFLFILYYTYFIAHFLDCTWLYVGVEDMKWAVIKNTLTKLISIVGIFTLVKTQNDIHIYVLIQGLSVLISNILAYTQLKLYVFRPKLDFEHLLKDIKESFILFLPSLAVNLYMQCDKIMIEWMVNNSAEVSFYDYSEKIVTIPLTFITMLSRVMMPRIANEYAKKNRENVNKLLFGATKFSLFIGFPMALGMIVTAPKLIPWYLGENFRPTIKAIVILAPIIITNALSGISGGQYFTATNQIRILLISQVSAVIFNIALNAVLIHRMGFVGAAIATVLTNILVVIIQFYYLFQQVKMKRISVIFFRYFLFSGIMFWGIYIFTKGMECTPTTNLLQVLTGVLIYFLLCLLSKDEQVLLVIGKAKELLLSKRR